MPINGSIIYNHINTLSKLGETSEGGVTRLSFDRYYLQAVELVSDWMNKAGLVVTMDSVGNLIGRKEGTDKDLPPIVIGSHIDTVINGGKFDGTVGVLSGLEIIRALEEEGKQLAHPIELISFVEEEGTRWGIPLLGSKVFAGLIQINDYLKVKDREGNTIGDAIQQFWQNQKKMPRAERVHQKIHAYIEMHIEQGAILDTMGLPLGIVTGIAGPLFITIILKGRTDHAGATPMHLRKDALVGAAKLVLEVKKIAENIADTTVATVGRLEVKPGAVNAVPGKVLMSFDIRDIHLENRNRVEEMLYKAIERISAEQHLEYEIQNASRVSPILINQKMIDIISDACQRVGVKAYKLPSGAGHDAQAMASITDTGMIFVRSYNGISHSPQEYSTQEDITLGAKVLYETILKVDMQ
jgi:allantoate deiminase